MPEGLEVRLGSLSLVGVGLEASSMINTQPDVSPVDLCLSALLEPFFFSFSKSSLRRLRDPFEFSGVVKVDDPKIPEGVLLVLRPDMLPKRSRGTRVCIRCSKFRTRARISETICTPLLFEVVPTWTATAEFMLSEEDSAVVRCESGGREVPIGVRGGRRDGENVGRVLERANEVGVELLEGVELIRGDWKPARFRRADWPATRPRGACRSVVSKEVGEVEDTDVEEDLDVDVDVDDDAPPDVRSERRRSEGGEVVMMSSLDKGTWGMRDDGAYVDPDSAVEALDCACVSWFFKTVISRLASVRRFQTSDVYETIQ